MNPMIHPTLCLLSTHHVEVILVFQWDGCTVRLKGKLSSSHLQSAVIDENTDVFQVVQDGCSRSFIAEDVSKIDLYMNESYIRLKEKVVEEERDDEDYEGDF